MIPEFDYNSASRLSELVMYSVCLVSGNSDSDHFI